ncbi:MAG: NACHT domain-containing protein [Propylenella sp.]
MLGIEIPQIDIISLVLGAVLLPVAVSAGLLLRRFLKRSLHFLLEGILFNLSFALTKAISYALTTRKYARIQLAGDSQYMQIPSTRPITVNVDRIFVPLSMYGANPGSGTFDHTSVLTAGNRLQVIGDPGSGKSSISKKLFRTECDKALRSFRNFRFPILLQLRSIDFGEAPPGKEAEWLMDYIRHSVARSKLYQIEACLDSYIRTSGLLLILDGLDEIASQSYERACRAINGIAEALSAVSADNCVILTMRTQFYAQISRDFVDKFPVTLSIRPFAPSDIYDFLNNWEFPGDKGQTVARIYNDLSDTPTLREMCSNPLILSMYVAQDQEGHSLAPDSRTEFYARVVDELLVRRRALQTGARSGLAAVRQQRQKVLGRLALNHLLDTGRAANSLDWTKAVVDTSAAIGLGHEQAEAVLREISKETGIITEEQEGESLRFIHLTFCEFMAAFEAIEGLASGWDSLKETYKRHLVEASIATRSRLAEVIPFACGLMPRHRRPRALAELVEVAPQRTCLLALLETKEYQSSIGSGLLVNTREQIAVGAIDGGQNLDYELIHLYLVLCVDADRDTAIHDVARASWVDGFFSRLNEVRPDFVEQFVSTYAKQDAVAALRVALLYGVDIFQSSIEIVIENCDQVAFLGTLLGKVESDPSQRIFWTSALAESGLRSRAVASMISKLETDAWRDEASNADQEFVWYRGGFVGRSPYTECLTVASAHLQAGDQRFPLLLKLREVRSPGRRFGDVALAWMTLLTMLLGYGLGVSSLIALGTTIGLAVFFSLMISVLIALRPSAAVSRRGITLEAMISAVDSGVRVERLRKTATGRIMLRLYPEDDLLSDRSLSRSFRRRELEAIREFVEARRRLQHA